VAALAVATLLSYLTLRFDEIYCAMLTLPFSMMVLTIAFQWRDVSGGSDSITGVIPDRQLDLWPFVLG
jgi:branched-chain amino acid transport system permease protein